MGKKRTMTDRSRRVTYGYECDHLKLVARRQGAWYHIELDGRLADQQCLAPVYRANVLVEGAHDVQHLVPE